MTVDLSAFEGASFGPYPLRVCTEKVRDFIDVTGMDPRRWEAAAPPGFLAAALFVVAPDLLSQLSDYSVIHGEQTFTWHEALAIEEDLQVSGSVTKVRERGDAYFVGFEMTVTGGGKTVASGTSLFLVSLAKVAEVSSTVDPTTPLDDGRPSHDQKSASRSDLVRYAAATRDWNPIHWDHETALAAGLEGVVVHGLLQAAWALDAAGLNTSGDRPFDFAKIRFRNPLLTAHPVDVSVVADGSSRTVTVSDSQSQFLSARVELVG